MFFVYFQSKKKLAQQINKLMQDKADIENKVVERERKKWFQDKMELISDYEGKILSESQKAADERELKMMEIIEAKDSRNRSLELDIIKLKGSYRKFKEDIHENEILTQELGIEMQSTMSVIRNLAAKFETIQYKMGRANQRIERKDRKMIEEGKS